MLSKIGTPTQIILSFMLGGITWGAIVLAESKLPYSRIRDSIVNTLALPAFVLSSIFFPEGPHTGEGVPYWGYWLLGFGVAFYTLVWFLILLWVKRRKV
jgi:hypothetical protein